MRRGSHRRPRLRQRRRALADGVRPARRCRPRRCRRGPTVSVFAGLVAASVQPGTDVIVATGDFTSVLFPMLVQESRGVRVREVALEQVPEAVDARTALIAVSAAAAAASASRSSCLRPSSPSTRSVPEADARATPRLRPREPRDTARPDARPRSLDAPDRPRDLINDVGTVAEQHRASVPSLLVLAASRSRIACRTGS